MSGPRETVTTQQTTTPQPTAQQMELTGLQLESARAAQPGLIRAQGSGLDLINRLLTGGTLPGFLQGLPGGISAEQTTDIAARSVEDIPEVLQARGVLRGGVGADLTARIAARTRTDVAQFNIQNLLQLLNLGVGGQAQVQQPILGRERTLSASLAGLTPVTTTGRQVSQQQAFALPSQVPFPSFQVGPFGF